MYGRQEARAALSRRPQAVEKAMQMKIKKVPWWNKRSRLERRLLLVTVSLILLISVLIAAIVLTVKSYDKEEVRSAGNDCWIDLTKYLNNVD